MESSEYVASTRFDDVPGEPARPNGGPPALHRPGTVGVTGSAVPGTSSLLGLSRRSAPVGVPRGSRPDGSTGQSLNASARLGPTEQHIEEPHRT